MLSRQYVRERPAPLKDARSTDDCLVQDRPYTVAIQVWRFTPIYDGTL